MKIPIFTLFTICLFCNCSSYESRIESFNNKIPIEDKLILEELVIFCNEIVYSKSQGHSFRKLLQDIETNGSDHWVIDESRFYSLVDKIENSTLEISRERLTFDTVYFEISENGIDTLIFTVTQEKDTIPLLDEIIGDEPLSLDLSVEAKIQKTQKRGYFNWVNSTFVDALIHDDNPVEINHYIEVRNLVGKTGYNAMTSAMIQDSTMNFDDYFIMRIIALDIVYEYLKKKYGC